jgi:MerR family transcriptional regulator, light-induced transcriptional regulator
VIALPVPCLSPGCGDYLAALVEGDARKARAVVEGLNAGGMDPRAVCVDILGRALNAVGDLWQHGELTVAQEHLATAITMAQLAWLAPLLVMPPPIPRLAILAGTPGELHVVGLRMVADFLEGDGLEVLDLGAATPADDLIALVAARGPDVVGLSTALTTHLLDARAIVAGLHALPEPPLVAVGGAAYGGDAELAAKVGADLFAADARVASELLRARFG